MAKNGQTTIKLAPVRAEERVQWARDRLISTLKKHLAEPTDPIWLSAVRARLAELEELERDEVLRAKHAKVGRPRRVFPSNPIANG